MKKTKTTIVTETAPETQPIAQEVAAPETLVTPEVTDETPISPESTPEAEDIAPELTETQIFAASLANALSTVLFGVTNKKIDDLLALGYPSEYEIIRKSNKKGDKLTISVKSEEGVVEVGAYDIVE